MDSSKDLGGMLVRLGYLSAERLDQVQQSTRSESLHDYLTRTGLVNRQAIRHATAALSGAPIVSLTGSDSRAPESEALALIPGDVATRYQVLPLSVSNGALEVAMIDPSDLGAADDLRAICGRQIRACLANEAEIVDAIRRHYGTSSSRMAMSLSDTSDKVADLSDESVGHLHELAREPSLVNLVNLLILEAAQDRASDIHIEPFDDQLRVKYRIDGVLHEVSPPSKRLQAAITSRIKIMAGLNIAERYVPQDGHIEFNTPRGRVDLRVSTVPTVFGESVVLRILDKTETLRTLGELGMGPDTMAAFESRLRRPHGIVLVTGPTGCGKTTTLYAALNHIYTTEKKIITIEDPVEFHLDGINQIPVNPQRGLTFANGLRSIVRQDPDIIMIGEIRDRETADIAIRSALTGHLVFSTLHTNDAPSAVTRLIDMGVEPFLLATTCEAIVAQRLIRLICPHCREPDSPPASALARLGGDESMDSAEFYRGRGCGECHQTGYRGRYGIFEILTPNDELRERILHQPTSRQVREAAGPEFITMRGDGCRKVASGVTSIDEVLRATEDVELPEMLAE
jgi:type II secretion system protein E